MSDNQQFCLRWNNHQSTLVQVIDSLLSSGVLVDCTLAAEGQYLHAHKVVLCACSPYLETLLSQHYEKHPIVILKDVKFQELKSMMDYMYKGEVNISQDQLGQFLKAAESLQIKGLTDGGGGENDSRDVGSTSSQKRHEPAPVRKTIPHNQSRSPVVLPSHTSGLTIEPSKRSIPTHLSDSQPDSPIRSREGSTSPTSRKRRRTRRLSQGDEDSHADNSCDLPMTSQSMSITSVPSSIPPLPSGSSSTITKAPPPDEDSENPESDRLGGLPEGLIKEKIEPQSEMLIEPKTEYMDETNNDDSVEDLTLDDDDDYENMMESGAGPSHSANNPNENYAAWQQITGDRQDDAYLNPSDTGHRDSQGECKLPHSSSFCETVFESRIKMSPNKIDDASNANFAQIMKNMEDRLVEMYKSTSNTIIEKIHDSGKKLESMAQSSISMSAILPSYDVLQLPVKDVDELRTMEDRLQNDISYRKTFIEYVSRLGGTNMRKKVHLIMNSVYHENITLSYSWIGNKRKAALHRTESTKIIIATLFEKNPHCRLREDIYNNIKVWLKNKGDSLLKRRSLNSNKLSSVGDIMNVDVEGDSDLKYIPENGDDLEPELSEG